MATLAVQRAGAKTASMARLTALVGAVNRRRRIPASPGEVLDAVHAVRRVALASPFRVACLEESVAAVIILAMLGKNARWCHGVAADPIRLHAWVETPDGDAAAEPPSTRRYTRTRVIPETKEPVTA
ncbi:lasso peptide biosynthesis B2 protein [Actinorugispora endophytica]|uniref:lasso peptide biosynthesis B2 protein n=1 Tax=Actinorugispora endophytica TaxID=1605990 RepID=UPI001AAE03E7|nr:lasso peptide biosynthesis B2 protein [Actinorugispora endophytica]